MTRQRTNFTLAPATLAILRGAGNASRYVDAAVVARDRRWRRALAFLERHGWNRTDLRAVLHGRVADARGPEGARLRVLAAEYAAGNDALLAALNARRRSA